MQGIIQSGMRAEESARPEQMPAGNGVDMEPERAQSQRNVLVNGMLSNLYGPMLENVSQVLRSVPDDPANGIGRVVGSLLSAAYRRLQEEGRTVTPGVMVQAGMIAAQAVGEMAQRMGIISADNEAEMVEGGFMIGLGRFGQSNADTLTQEQRQRYAELIDAMEEGKRMAMEGGDRQPQRGNRQASAAEGDMGPRGGMMMQGGA